MGIRGHIFSDCMIRRQGRELGELGLQTWLAPGTRWFTQCCSNWKSHWHQEGVAVRSPVLALTALVPGGWGWGKAAVQMKGRVTSGLKPIKAQFLQVSHEPTKAEAPHPICQRWPGYGPVGVSPPLSNHRETSELQTRAVNKQGSQTRMWHCAGVPPGSAPGPFP